MVGRLWRSDQSREDPPPRLPRRGQPSLPTRALGNGTIPILGADLLIVCKAECSRFHSRLGMQSSVCLSAVPSHNLRRNSRKSRIFCFWGSTRTSARKPSYEPSSKLPVTNRDGNNSYRRSRLVVDAEDRRRRNQTVPPMRPSATSGRAMATGASGVSA